MDLLPSRDGTVFVLEVNGIPGWQGLKQATGIDVAGAIVEHLAARVRARAAPTEATPRSCRHDETPSVRVARPALARDIASAAQLACLLEASAPKPGNVSPGRHFADARYEDFLASAVAIGAPLAGAGTAASRRDRPARGRGHGALDALEHQPRHRAAAGAARASGAATRSG